MVTAALGPSQALAAEQTIVGKPLSKQAVLSELTTNVDSKKSKAGDKVTAKTLNPLKLNDGTRAPQGHRPIRQSDAGAAKIGWRRNAGHSL